MATQEGAELIKRLKESIIKQNLKDVQTLLNPADDVEAQNNVTLIKKILMEKENNTLARSLLLSAIPTGYGREQYNRSLWGSSKTKNPKIIEALLDFMPEVDIENWKDEKENFDKDDPQSDGISLLMIAANSGKDWDGVTKKLLTRADVIANIDKPDKYVDKKKIKGYQSKRTALEYAIGKENFTAISLITLNRKDEVTEKLDLIRIFRLANTYFKATSIDDNNYKVFKKLFKNINSNSTDYIQMFRDHYKPNKINKEFVMFLIQEDQSVNHDFAKNMLGFYLEIGDVDYFNVLRENAIIKNIIAKDPYIFNLLLRYVNPDKTPNYINLIEELVAKGADLTNAWNEKSDRATFLKILKEAITSGKETIVSKLLARKNIELFIDDIQKQGMIFLAVKANNAKVVSALLKAGVSPMFCSQTEEAVFPKLIAQEYGFDEIAILLENAEKEQRLKQNAEDLNHIKFVQNVGSIKRFGHILGITNTITINSPIKGEKIVIKSEGNYTLPSNMELNKQLEKYLAKLKIDSPNSTQYSQWEMIAKAFKEEEKFLKHGIEPKDKVTTQDLLKRINKGELTTFPGGWNKHAITIVFYKDYLIVCNRGVGRHPDEHGTHIYKMSKEAKEILNEPGYFESLRPTPDATEMSVMQSRMDRLIKECTAVAALPTKSQKHGTCSFVNAKSACEGILFVQNLMALEEQYKLTQETALNSDQKRIDSAKQSARKGYKQFTTYLRDTEINQLISEMKEKDADIETYHGIIRAYLEQHFTNLDKYFKDPDNRDASKDDKRILELKRAKILLDALDPYARMMIIQNLMMESHRKERSQLYDLAKFFQTKANPEDAKELKSLELLIKSNLGTQSFEQESTAKGGKDRAPLTIDKEKLDSSKGLLEGFQLYGKRSNSSNKLNVTPTSPSTPKTPAKHKP